MIHFDVFRHTFTGCLCGHNEHRGRTSIRRGPAVDMVDVVGAVPACDHCTSPEGCATVFVSPERAKTLTVDMPVTFGPKKEPARIVELRGLRQFPRAKPRSWAVVIRPEYP